MKFFSEIPLFHVLTAKITFENIYASDTPVESVRHIPPAEEDGLPSGACDISDTIFQIPADYEHGDAWWRDDLAAMDEEVNVDDILGSRDEPDSDST